MIILTMDTIIEKRKRAIKSNKINFLPLLSIDSPGMPFIINFSDQMEYFAKHGCTVKNTLQVHCILENPYEDFLETVTLMSKERTQDYALSYISNFGPDSEERLIINKTATLYWNVIYHFGSFKEL
jgi:hypothetical protein